MSRWPLGSLVLAGLVLAGMPASAANIIVTPVRVTLSARAPIASLEVKNGGDAGVLMQVRLRHWTQSDGKDVLSPTDDLLANPPGFRLAAGASQIVRFGLERKPPAVEGTYRVLITQVPEQHLLRAGEVQTVLNISIPIFVEGPNDKPDVLWSLRRVHGTGLQLEAINRGTAHIEIGRLRISTPKGQLLVTLDKPAYVLAGQRHSWTLPDRTAIASGTTVTLNAETDSASLERKLIVGAGGDAEGTE